jgi:hypothetical protein
LFGFTYIALVLASVPFIDTRYSAKSPNFVQRNTNMGAFEVITASSNDTNMNGSTSAKSRCPPLPFS